MLKQQRPEWDAFEHHEKMLSLLPENDALENLPTELWETLTPLERVVVWWHFTRGGLDVIRIQALTVVGVIPYELLLDVWRRKHIREVCRKIRKLKPFLGLYSADYFVELLHEEIDLLRARTRIARNISNHERDNLDWRKNDREDVQTLLRCLELVHKFSEVNKDADANAGASPSRLDRVITQAEEFIEQAEGRHGDGVDGGPPKHA